MARAANVARSTAAQALAGTGGANARVGPETAQRIRLIAAKLNYRPNSLASGLRGSVTRSVGAIWTFVDPSCSDAEIGNAILCRLQSRGLATYQAHHPTQPQQTARLLDDLLQRRLDALVIRLRHDHFDCPEIRQRLEAFRSVIAVVPWAVPGIRMDQLVHDRDPGIRQAMAHFASTGRRRIGIVLSLDDLSEQHKLHVFRECCLEYGLDDQLCPCMDLRHAGDRHESRIARNWALLEQTLGRGVKLDAIFCSNHIGTMTVARWLRQHGLRVPEDVALAGLNDNEAAELWDPPLAMVDRRQDQVVQQVCEMLERRMAEPTMPPRQCAVPMQFVWRESAGRSVAETKTDSLGKSSN